MPDDRRREPLELEHYWTVVRRYWGLLLAGIAVPALAAVLYIAVAPRVYEATATVSAVTARRDASVPPGSTATARALFDNRSLASEIVEEFGLQSLTPSITPSVFLQDVLRVDEVRGTNFLRVNVRLRDPELAARVVNRVCELAATMNRSVANSEEAFARDALKARLEAAEGSLQEIQEKLIVSRSEGPLGLPLEQRARLSQLLLDIQAEKAKIAEAQAQIGSLSSGGQAALSEGDAGQDLRAMLLSQVAASSSRIATLERQRLELLDRTKGNRAVRGEPDELHKRQLTISRLEAEHEAIRAVYADLARRYHQARIEIIGRDLELGMAGPALDIVDPAVAPTRPAVPRPERILAVAVLGGLVLSLLGIFVLDALRQGTSTGARVGAWSGTSPLERGPSVISEEEHLREPQHR